MPRRDRWISPIPALKAIIIKQYINTLISEPAHRDFCHLALGAVLRPISNMKLSPHAFGSRKTKEDAPVYTLFSEKIHKMLSDVEVMAKKCDQIGYATIIEADARLTDKFMLGLPVADLAVTSPPYLNNLDYTMQTRLELFFLDFVKNMKDLKDLRKRMVTCDAKAIYRDIKDHKEVGQFESIQHIVAQLHDKLGHRKWGWDYPFMTLQYFGGLLRVLRSIRSCLKTGARFLLVVGESAHAGIKVPVPTILGELGEASGYQLEDIRIERYRRSSSHSFRLAESTVILRCP